MIATGQRLRWCNQWVGGFSSISAFELYGGGYGIDRNCLVKKLLRQEEEEHRRQKLILPLCAFTRRESTLSITSHPDLLAVSFLVSPMRLLVLLAVSVHPRLEASILVFSFAPGILFPLTIHCRFLASGKICMIAAQDGGVVGSRVVVKSEIRLLNGGVFF